MLAYYKKCLKYLPKTDSVILDSDTPKSNAFWLVHLPVPF